MDEKSWNLAADIGGTHARFGLLDNDSGVVAVIKHYSVAEHSTLMAALNQFLSDVQNIGEWALVPRSACMAVAADVDGEIVPFTNSPWVVSRKEIQERLQTYRVELINDFAAIGYGICELGITDWRQIGGTTPVVGKPIVILGPGTGLGVCTVMPVGTGFQVLEGEGGHVDFAPVNAEEIAVLEVLTAQFGRVSLERLLSGSGIKNIYAALSRLASKPEQYTSPESITHAALHKKDPTAVDALVMFCRVLGSAAGNMALSVGAKGGVYIAGGIVPNIKDFLANSDFRQRFEAKGRFQTYMEQIPVRVVLKPDLGILGAAKKISFAQDSV